MKKTVLSLAVASLILTGCSSKSKELSKKTNDGKDVIASVGSEYIYTDDINNAVVDTHAGNKSIYNQVTKLLVQTANPVTSDIKASAEVKVEQFKTTAKETATANSTTYEEELDQALATLGVETLKDLQKYYEYELQKSKLTDKYWKEFEEQYFSEYVDNALPYHISHTLVSVGTTDMYFLDTITEDYAKKIGNVIKDLRTGKTFDFVAENYSDDTSANVGGDLGLMDVNTSFVNEFKYSVYMLDYYTQLTKNHNFLSSTSKLYQDTVKALKASDYYANGLNEIPMSAASLLLSAADKTDYNVNNYSYTRTYTRNILFNEYFNQPGVSVIVFDDDTQLIENTVDANGKVTKYGNYVTLKTSDDAEPVKVLASNGNVVMAVRSASLDSSSGIHFITINQSPLAANAKEYFANDTEKDEDGNYLRNTYISLHGEDNEKTSKETLVNAVKSYIENGVAAADEAKNGEILEANMFEYYYNANKDKITLAEGIEDVLEDYITFVKKDHEQSFLDSFENARDTYIKLLNTFTSFKNDAHYIPVGCIDSEGNTVYVTIDGSSVKACTRKDGHWVVRSSESYKVTTTVTTGVSVNSSEKTITKGENGSIELTLEDGYTLTGEAGKTALTLSINDAAYTIGTTTLENISVAVDGNKVTITFTAIAKNHTVKVTAA